MARSAGQLRAEPLGSFLSRLVLLGSLGGTRLRFGLRVLILPPTAATVRWIYFVLGVGVMNHNTKQHMTSSQ